MSAVGFTGSQRGLSLAQEEALRSLLASLREHYTAFHHGDCIGADASAAITAYALGFWTVAHPGDSPEHTANSSGDERRSVRPNLVRNHDIVDEVEVMVATPSGYTPLRRSGTWATIRYTRKQHKALHIVWPDGRVEEEAPS